MTTTTTSSIEGKKIVKYLGIVTGEAVIGSNLLEDVFHGLKGIVGGRSTKFEKKLSSARAMAMKLMRENAEQLGANAIVGVDLDYEALDAGDTLLMVIANGTAVVVQ